MADLSAEVRRLVHLQVRAVLVVPVLAKVMGITIIQIPAMADIVAVLAMVDIGVAMFI